MTLAERSGLVSPLIDKIIELDRLLKEGPTLKNVAENFRTLMVLVALGAALAFAWEGSNFFGRFLIALFGVWVGLYAFVACLQTGLLVGLLGFELLWTRKELFSTRRKFMDLIAFALGALAGLVMVGSIWILFTAIIRSFNTVLN